MLPMLRGHEDVDALAGQSDVGDVWRAGSYGSVGCRLVFLNTGCNSAKRARKSDVAHCQTKQSTSAYVGQDLLLCELLLRTTTGKRGVDTPFHHRRRYTFSPSDLFLYLF